MAESTVSVADVYEHAALIGKDIESMVSEYGEKVIENIMPKIVYVLEQLETLAEKCETDQQRINELTMERERLIIHTKRDEAIQRQLHEKLLYTDGLLSKDKKDLHVKIKKLKQENDILHDELDKREDELVTLKTQGALPGDVEVMLRMKSTIDEQRDEIRSLNSQLSAQKEDIDALHEHTNRITSLNERLLNDQTVMSAQLKTSDDSGISSNGHHDNSQNGVMNSPETKHETSLQDELMGLNYTLDPRLEEENDNINNTSINVENNNNLDETKENEAPTKIVSEGLTLTADKSPSKDPDRPRYTLMELQKLLEEKNIYKDKMFEYMEELQLYKNQEVGLKTPAPDSESYKRRPGGVRNLMQKFLGR